jgi:hypothetical protein
MGSLGAATVIRTPDPLITNVASKAIAAVHPVLGGDPDIAFQQAAIPHAPQNPRERTQALVQGRAMWTTSSAGSGFLG